MNTQTNLNITSNKDAREYAPKGVEGNYIIVSELLGVTKIGRTANLECDYRAATRYLPDAKVVAFKVTGDVSVSRMNEEYIKGFFSANNVPKNSGKASEVYRNVDTKELVKALDR